MAMMSRIQDASKTDWLIGLAVYIVIILAVAGLSKWLVDRSEEIVTANDVGNVISVEYINGGAMDTDKTRVETSKGVFLVYGTPSVMKDSAFTIETRKNDDRMLCGFSDDRCRKLIH